MNKTLIVRCNENEANFTVNSTQEKISAFTKWSAEYNHGTFDGIETINCSNLADFRACMHKARREGLIPCITQNEVKAKFASM